MVDDTIKEINDKLDFIGRVHTDTAARYAVCQATAGALARAVNEHLTYGTSHTHRNLKDAYDAFVSMEAGGFHGAGWKVQDGVASQDPDWASQ